MLHDGASVFDSMYNDENKNKTVTNNLLVVAKTISIDWNVW